MIAVLALTHSIAISPASAYCARRSQQACPRRRTTATSGGHAGFIFEAQTGPRRLAGSNEAAFAILHKEEHIGLLIKHKPECLWIGHAGEKGALE